MGGTKAGRKGFEVRGSTIRIYFFERGKKQSGTLKIPPTPANLKYAQQVAEEIQQKIDFGIFNYAEYFPNSRRARAEQQQAEEATAGQTFAEVAELWFATASNEIAKGTTLHYRGHLDRHWLPYLAATPIRDIRYLDLTLLINGYNEKDKKTHKTSICWISPTQRNAALVPLRQVFAFALAADLIDVNPMAKIRTAKTQAPDPDPLSPEEVELVLDYMRRRYPINVANYFQFAFYTGMRPSEMIALTWGDVDFRQQTVRVNKAWSYKELKETKTYSSRDVRLNARAMQALQTQKACTFMKGTEALIFTNPHTQERWLSNDQQNSTYWKPALRALGIRTRHCYQTRHTFATMNLMAGANPMWVSKQMGHSTMQMLLNVYAKWIDKAEKSREVDKLEEWLNQHKHDDHGKRENG